MAGVLVEGRPRHHKHKHAHVENHGNEDPKAFYQQPATNQPFADAPAGPQDLNVYNVHVQKMADNKVSGHIGPHSVSVSMQGPGSVSLDTTQQVVGPDEPKPDHTVTMVKDTGGCNGPECSSVNVHSGHQLPMPLPLTGPATPLQAPKESNHHDLKPPVQPKEPAKLHTKPQPKVEHAHVHAPAEHADNGKVHVHTHVNKEHANKIITNLESTIPVVAHTPKKEEAVSNGHKVFLSNAGKPQKVFGQMDSNNVGVTMQGPGTTSVTSQFDVPNVSQTVVFDPMPAEPCNDQQCAKGKEGEHKGKGHH
ncbi:hypothetical protein ACROYT_G023490 [Oculina patagonica]